MNLRTSYLWSIAISPPGSVLVRIDRQLHLLSSDRKKKMTFECHSMIWAIKQRKRFHLGRSMHCKKFALLKAKFYIFFGYYFFKPELYNQRKILEWEKKLKFEIVVHPTKHSLCNFITTFAPLSWKNIKYLCLF